MDKKSAVKLYLNIIKCSFDIITRVCQALSCKPKTSEFVILILTNHTKFNTKCFVYLTKTGNKHSEFSIRKHNKITLECKNNIAIFSRKMKKQYSSCIEWCILDAIPEIRFKWIKTYLKNTTWNKLKTYKNNLKICVFN